MNRFYWLVFMALSPLVSLAQGKIGYSYDAAGNRVRREIVMAPTRAMAGRPSSDPGKQVFSDRLHDCVVRIYPNPTDGLLRIRISGLTGTERCSLRVYTSPGAQIMAKDMDTDNAEIDISGHPAGVYLLGIDIDGKTSTWKIIKK